MTSESVSVTSHPDGESPVTRRHSAYRPRTEFKATRLRREIYRLGDLDTVLIYRENENEELINYKVCNFADQTLFTAVQVLSNPTSPISPPVAGHSGGQEDVTEVAQGGVISRRDSSRQSFQYLVRRFNRNDPLVIKTAEFSNQNDVSPTTSIPEKEIHCSDGNVIGYCARSAGPGLSFEVMDCTHTNLYTFTRKQSSGYKCFPFFKSKKSSSTIFEVLVAVEKSPIATLELHERNEKTKPLVLSFPDHLDETYKALFVGAALTMDGWSDKKHLKKLMD